MENDDSLECKKIAQNLPNEICIFIKTQAAACMRYRKYTEYIEWLNGWEDIWKSVIE
jgi:hypothetical protein